MLKSILYPLSILLLTLLEYSRTLAPTDVVIQGIEPNSGPVSGETRVIVRLKDFDKNLIESYPRPKCRFGTQKDTVNATYVSCSPKPRAVSEKEPTKAEMNETCIICENSPQHKEEYVPFTISLIGDFSDVKNSIPYRYYKDPVISWIYPRYGPKDGGTFVEVYGENFLNFDQNLRCGFGTLEVKAYYVSENYLICYSPKSEVIGQPIPFTISLNNQQNTLQHVPYVYYSKPQVFRLEPNRGPDTGKTLVRIRGQNFNPLVELPHMTNHNDTFCKFGQLSIEQAKVISSTEIECYSPPSFEDREVEVEITLNNREWTEDNVLFYYYHPPFVYSIIPKMGPISGGTVVTITGSNFENTGYVMCLFGNTYAKGEYISQNELKCVSPRVEKAGTVGLAVAIREDEFSSGVNTKYRYYSTPSLEGGEPLCGPMSGDTQITLYGTNFPRDEVQIQCVFNRKYFRNATVMSDTELKCNSPSQQDGSDFYDVEITLNRVNFEGPPKKFYYYNETYITGVYPKFGPIEGDTTLNITGTGFAQRGACNVTARIATYQMKPLEVTDNYMIVKTPKVNLPGATVVTVALNGKQFEKDIALGIRNIENTFYYTKQPFATDMKPTKGTNIGGTKISLTGTGFKDPFDSVLSSDYKLYYRFIDCADNTIVFSPPNTFTKVSHNHKIEILSPKVYRNNTLACLQLSYNNIDFKTVPNKSFSYYILPNITSVTPQYGPLVSNDFDKVKVKIDDFYCTENCDKILCQFKSKNNIFLEKGNYIGPNTVNCTVPRVNIPESFNVELSFNSGEDYTNNGYSFTFYDPYVLRVEPQMISSKGGTKLKIFGYGFADSGENLKVRFGNHKGSPLKCNFKSCIRKAKYISENEIEVETFPRNEVLYDISGQMIGYERFPVEVSVYNDDFTNTNVTIFYFDEPEIIQDLYDAKIKMNSSIRDALAESLVNSYPSNINSMIPVPVDSSGIYNYLDQMYPFANFTCKYTMKTATETFTKITYGVFSSFPFTSKSKNLFLCQSPMWEVTGDTKIQISMNGYDFSTKDLSISFTDPINVIKVEPKCGPLNGGTIVDFYGTGFDKKKEFVFKWGPQNLVPMESASFLDYINESNKSSFKLTPQDIQKVNPQFKIEKIQVKSPEAPFYQLTSGGVDYLAITKLNYFPSESYENKFSPSLYLHTKHEFYYYRQPYIQSFLPRGTVINGGTVVTVVGAWFEYLPEYGVKPYCKFGDKIVEGTYLNTVRITCVAPVYDTPNVRVNLCVSLNKFDWTCADQQFTFYNDFTKAKFDKMVPQSGPETGGTQIKIFGQNFTNLASPEEFVCKFQPEAGSEMPAKIVPAGYQEFTKTKQTAIICNSPGGWTSGTKANILISFDGQNFINTGFNFYFYKIDLIKPKSGPNVGGGSIGVYGGGFKNSSKVRCDINEVSYSPSSMNEHLIQCPLPPAPNKNYTGFIDLGIVLNGIDQKLFPKGFYYYKQISVDSIYPPNGPNSGNAKVKVYGKGFRNDFPGIDLGCKVGNNYGKGEYVSSNEMNCYFNRLPLLSAGNSTMNLSVALNNYSFTEETAKLSFTPYGIIQISPSSGPIIGNTRIEIRGAGFFDSKKIRCRFGVPGYYFYTQAEYINSNLIVCNSPEDFKVPIAGQLPFSVPLSIAFNDDEFQPWTESGHFFSFYEEYKIVGLTPLEGSTKTTTEIKVFASEEKPFSLRNKNYFKYKFFLFCFI